MDYVPGIFLQSQIQQSTQASTYTLTACFSETAYLLQEKHILLYLTNWMSLCALMGVTIQKDF